MSGKKQKPLGFQPLQRSSSTHQSVVPGPSSAVAGTSAQAADISALATPAATTPAATKGTKRRDRTEYHAKRYVEKEKLQREEKRQKKLADMKAKSAETHPAPIGSLTQTSSTPVASSAQAVIRSVPEVRRRATVEKSKRCVVRLVLDSRLSIEQPVAAGAPARDLPSTQHPAPSPAST